MTPAIVEAWFSTSSELTAAMALIQTVVIAATMMCSACSRAAPSRSTESTANDRDLRPAPAIEVENLSIRYGSVTAVETVSFTVEPGQQLTLLGPSGCGKTSTLRAVAGLETADLGRDPHRRQHGVRRRDAASTSPAEQRGMSMVFQSYAIWPHMTVFDNVAYGLRVRNESGAALTEKVRHALDLVKMGAVRRAQRLRSSRAASSSASRSRAPSPSRRRCCCSTSRCPISTPSCARRCASSCASCSAGSASPRSTSRTIWRRRWRCPTASS